VGDGLGVDPCGGGQERQRGVVVDRAFGSDHAAVTVLRVFAEAYVGDQDETGTWLAKRTEGHGHGSKRIRGALAPIILLGRQSEQEKTADPRGARSFGDPRDLTGGKTRVPR